MKTLSTILVSLLFAANVQTATIHVPADESTIQAGIDAAVDGDTVLVADGTYYENINYKGKAITVASHYFMDGDTSHISQTIIDGSRPANPDSGSVVYFVSGEDTTSVLSGFTITNGSGTITDEGYKPVRAGGGIICYNSGAKIVYNRIIDNHVPDYVQSAAGGIGAYPDGSDAYLVIKDNQIINNTTTGEETWGAGVDLLCNGRIINNNISFNSSTATKKAFGVVTCWSYTDDRNIVINKNRITHNIADGPDGAFGGGLDIEGNSNATVVGNEITYNQVSGSDNSKGGGIYLVLRTGKTVIDGNTISHNAALGSSSNGGGISLHRNKISSNTSILNNVITANSAEKGGGIRTDGSRTQIINNTVVSNVSSEASGLVGKNNTVVMNSIFWNNQPATGQVAGDFILVAYSDIQDSVWAGENNISADPVFADTLFHLSENSPCVGAGIDSFSVDEVMYSAPAIDFAGHARPYDQYVDMGALESEYITAVDRPKQTIAQTFTLEQNYPNPFNPTTAIEYALPKPGHVRITIYDMLGRHVRTLVEGRQAAGRFQTLWDGRDEYNVPVAAGVYFYKMEAGDPSASSGQRFVRVNKLALVR